MSANTTNFTESGVDLADKYISQDDYTLLPSDYFVGGFDETRYTYGNLWAFGYNYVGELAQNNNGSATNKSSPVQVGSLTNWKQVYGEKYSVLSIKVDGSLWAWGDNYEYKLGLSDSTDKNSPVQVGSLKDWKSLGGGEYHIIAIKTNGTLWAWGHNNLGQLGLGNLAHRSSPTQVGSLTDWKKTTGQHNYGGLATGCIKTDGTLWTWGYPFGGNLGQNDLVPRSSPVQVGSLTDWKEITGGSSFMTSIKTDGTIWTWGKNNNGELGLGDLLHRSSPVQIGSLTDWKNLSSGLYHTASIKTDGSLWTWGFAAGRGVLGLGDINSRSSPVQIGSLTNWKQVSCSHTHSSAIKTDGTLWTWGHNNFGQLGQGNITNYSSPVQVGSLTNWKQISCSIYSTFGIK